MRALQEELATGSTPAPRVPADWLAFTGTAIIALVFVQFATGVMLFSYYYPHVAKAFSSHQAIANEVPFGFLVETLHAMGAKMIVALAFLHLFLVWWHGSYRGPRARIWYAGMGLLLAFLVTGFSGYLLPWSQQSFWACVVGTEALRAVPLIGGGLVWLLRGGENVGQPTLVIFYLCHVLFLPAAIVTLLYFHVKWVWKAGVTGPSDTTARPDLDKCLGCKACSLACPFTAIQMIEVSGRKRPALNEDACNACRACVILCPASCISLRGPEGAVRNEPLWPHAVLRRIMASLGAVGLLFFSAFFLHGLFIAGKTPADPLLTPDRIKPDWYFLAPYQVLKVLPSERWGLAVLFLLTAALCALPALDPKGLRDPARRTVHRFLVKAAAAGLIVFTIWGYLS
ncbi:MAG: cytochrome b N-terminal domain-containing protein [Thermodesulfobacteriota bacterium]